MLNCYIQSGALGPKMHITLSSNAPAITCVALDLVSIARTKVVFAQVAMKDI